jgi:hypothetical protein
VEKKAERFEEETKLGKKNISREVEIKWSGTSRAKRFKELF